VTAPTAARGSLSGATGSLRPPAESLDPRVRRLWAAEIGLWAGGAGLAAAAALGALTALGELPAAPLAWSALGLALALALAAALVLPGLRYRVFRWEVTPLGLYIQRGWLWRSWTVVPHSRIQSIETTVGPLARWLGLAEVEVSTASNEGGARVPGLSAELVARLTAELAARSGEGDAT